MKIRVPVAAMPYLEIVGLLALVFLTAASPDDVTFALTLPPGVTCPITATFQRIVPGGTPICTLAPAGSYSASAGFVVSGGVLQVGGQGILQRGTVSVVVTSP